ncbi:pentatricopeptide repeat-containing protein At3g26782, mitochondrial-like [Selaginella moellendorffii]|uniref:pentatricopeptide repeat-containing protein At3g26782, mitochondrial-like n=1 Tax=Selaginella moellendorffii TaxID=88036 RepID=UPI000D1CDB87|nr:pentatricopeptide repeat-containing protein At3g26782, mitochondrial-like [Selaginella moellendorffii]|eukprot:XP_024532931.1 pentatricopeptide repeat-containing protein At3g26782, mitochondrial-like [Selaginella moellendorffii]
MRRANVRICASRLLSCDLSLCRASTQPIWQSSKIEENRLVSRSFDGTGFALAASRACGILRDLETARRLHKDAIAIDGNSNIYIASSLVDSYAKCGSLVDARSAFEAMDSRNAVAWTSLILGCAENGEAEAGLELFQRIIDEGCEPSARSFVAALKCCSRLAREEEGSLDRLHGKTRKKLRSLARGAAIHRLIEGCVDIFVAGSLIDMYASCGDLRRARRVFDRIPCHNLVAWNAMILGYAEQGDGRSSLELYDRLSSVPGMVPDARTIGAALKACSLLAADKHRNEKFYEKLEHEEHEERIEHEEQEHSNALQVRELLDKGRQLFSRAVELGYGSDVFLLNTVVDFYAKCGSLAEARAVFDRIPCKTCVSWNALMLGYVENGHAEQALDLFMSMPDEMDSTTFAAAFKACGSRAFLGTGKSIHAHICRCGAEKNLVVATGALDFYSKCGNMVEAQHIFDSMPSKNTVTWTALIGGFSRLGGEESTQQVFDLFREMLDGGLKPDGATLVLVIAACSHAGLVDKGRKIFEEVLPRHCVSLGIEHYHALIDLLGRANELQEALDVAETMPFKPSFVTWMTLLACCKKWGNAAIGKLAFQRLIAIDATDPTAYVLLEKIYASQGSWKELAEIEEMRKKKKAKTVDSLRARRQRVDLGRAELPIPPVPAVRELKL